MKLLICTNQSKAVQFQKDAEGQIVVTAMQWNEIEKRYEFWFSIGTFKTFNGAKRSAIKQMSDQGYHFSDNAIMNFKSI